MQQITKGSLLALDNAAILYQAAAAGMSVHPEDVFVNYAEIDLTIEKKEDQTVKKIKEQIEEAAAAWLEGISSPEDLDPETLDLESILQKGILDHIKSVWKYGQDEAAKEIKRMEIAQNSELSLLEIFAAGKDIIGDDLGNEDAFEWYEKYTQQLATSGKDDLYIRMQPQILEALDAGLVRMTLAQTLAADFARYGAVRADIISRTESSKAFNWGRRYRFDQSDALSGYRYSAIMDERTTPICRGLHGSSWERGSSDLDAYTPPNHFRCRSILVPINKYRDWTFQDPDLSDLSDKDQEMLKKFSDFSWFPKPSTVKTGALPVAAVPKAAAPVIDPGPDPAQSSKEIQEIVDHSRANAEEYVQGLIDYNVKRGIRADHPMMLEWGEMIKDIQGDKYEGKMILAEWNKRSKNNVKISTFEPYGDIFVGELGKISKKDKALLMADLDKIKDDPLFKGVKIQLENTSQLKGFAAYYSPSKDLMGYTKSARGLDTLYHEIGHRVHNNPGLYKSSYDELLRKNKINITQETWDKWKDQAETFWEPERTKKGSKLLPDEVYSRFEYPINAKFHYDKGTKANFQKEMFAETTSVYLEGDPEWIEKVNKAYPGLLEFMEKEVYQLGKIKS